MNSMRAYCELYAELSTPGKVMQGSQCFLYFYFMSAVIYIYLLIGCSEASLLTLFTLKSEFILNMAFKLYTHFKNNFFLLLEFIVMTSIMDVWCTSKSAHKNK